MVSSPSLQGPSHTNPWLAIVNLRTYERLDVQEGVQNDHKATCSAVFILYASTLLLCSLFRMSGQDSAGRNREIHAAAICTVVLWVIPIWGIDRQALIAVRGPLSVLFWSYYSHYSKIMRIILAIMLIISKIRMAFLESIHCGNPFPWFLEAAQKQQLILYCPLPSSPVQWMSRLPPPSAGPHMCPWGI